MGSQMGIPPNIIMKKSQKGVFNIQIQSINGLKKKLNNYPHLDELEDFLQKNRKKGFEIGPFIWFLSQGNLYSI